MYYEMLNNIEIQLQFVAVAVIDEKTAYAVSYKINGLFKIDLETEVCEFIQFFPDLDVCKSWLFFSAVKGENGIYFTPSSADYIALYDIGENKIHQIPLPELEKLHKDSNYRLGDAFYAHGNVYFVGATCGCILKLKESAGEMAVIDPDIQEEVFFRRGMLVNDIYYTPSANSAIIMEYRLKTDEVIVHKIGEVGGARSIWGDGERFWLPPRDKVGAVRCWNKSTGKTSTIKIQVNGYQPQEYNFLKVFNSGDSLIVSPECANMFLRVDMQTDRIEQFDIPCVNDVERYGYCFETSNCAYFIAYINKQEEIDFKIDKETLAVNRVRFTLKNRDIFIKAVGAELKRVDHIMKESEMNNLEEFIALVQLLS